jgi:hypothetical protein
VLWAAHGPSEACCWGEPFGIFSPQVHTSCISGSTRNYA